MIRQRLLAGLFLALFTGACLGGTPLQAEEPKQEAKAADSKVYELRIYTCHPGKLDALHRRFREHTLRIFGKHGMKNVIYLTPLDQEETLVYLITHESREAADKNWDAFRNDDEWKKVYEESHRDGPLVKKVERQFLKATDYSPLK